MEYPQPSTSIFISLLILYYIARRIIREDKQYLLFSYVISTLHAFLVGVYGWYKLMDGWYEKTCIFTPNITLITQDQLNHQNLMSSNLLDNKHIPDWTFVHVMVAYMMADTICVAMWHSPRSIVAHHLIASVGLSICYYFNIGYGLALRMALTETATVMLNICWYLKRAEKDTNTRAKNDIVFKICVVLLILLYGYTRVWSIPEIVRKCYPEMIDVLPWYLAVFGIVVMSYMQAMNVYWWLQIVKRAISG